LLTQKQLARMAKVALRTIVNIEARAAPPRLSTRARLLRALGIDFAEHRRIFDEEKP
jgi:transcriptional regulator with XRE-family HTH domain